MGRFFINMIFVLNSETLSAPTTAACIRVVKVKAFTIQSVTKFQFGIYKV